MKKKELNILQEVINVIGQYFPELINKFGGLTDIRNQSYIQKNGTFDIGHLYSKNVIAIKVHYLLMQITHIIRQLIEKRGKKHKGIRTKNKRDKQLLKTTLISTITNLTVHGLIQLRFD